MAAEKPGSKVHAWFCTTGMPSDVVVEVGEMSFHLHKSPLMSKSRKLHRLITEQEQDSRRRTRRQLEDAGGNEQEEEIQEEEEEEEEEESQLQISLPGFPGGAEAFELAAKFCYGVRIDLTARNAAALHCAAEHLEMTDDFADENLASRADRFLARSVPQSLTDSILALKSCEQLLPLAEELGVVQRLIDSVAARAAAETSSSLFGWPVSDGGAGDRHRRSSWIEELAVLGLPVYRRVIEAMKGSGVGSDAIERSLISYAGRSIPGLSRSGRRRAFPSEAPASEPEQRELLETVLSNLPVEKASPPATATKFLFGLLRTAQILRASEASRAALERKIASQLEQATLEDLLIPSYSGSAETLYDVDCVQRILRHYLESLGSGGAEEEITAAADESSLVAVGRLVDGYLAEIAPDENLRPEMFREIASALPDRARVYHDGLYRAVDIYLEAHPRLGEEERERVSGVVDGGRLTVEACTHAAQNERLPLRTVLRVLFSEQVQLRRAVAGGLLGAAPGRRRSGEEERGGGGGGGGGGWRAAVRENQVLRLDMDGMRNRVRELERECSSMRKTIEKMERGQRAAAAATGGGRGMGRQRRTRGQRRFGCRFTTQVCDSHERTVVESRASRAEQRSP